MTKRKTLPDIDTTPPVKATDAEVLKRVATVCKLMIAGASRASIVQYGSIQWDITDRQIDDYIARAKNDIATMTDKDKESNLNMAMARMNDIYQQCYAAKNYKGAMSAQIEINKLLGLYAPAQQEIKHSGGLHVKAYKEFTPDAWDSDDDRASDNS